MTTCHSFNDLFNFTPFSTYHSSPLIKAFSL
jgi:hypothetical protein